MQDTSLQVSLIELLSKGGWVMLPLALCSLIAVAVVIERAIWGPRRARVIPKRIRSHIGELLSKRKFEEIIGLCRADDSPVSRIVLAALENTRKPPHELREAIEMAGRKEASTLERYTGILGTIAAIAPLLGLLGTVFGMIKTFAVIRVEGVGDANALAGGISEALLTTAAGLAIAIPSLVMYRYYLHMTKKRVLELEQIALAVAHEISGAPSQLAPANEQEDLRARP